MNGNGSVVTGAGGVLTIGAANNLASQFDGVISGAGTLTKNGTGTFTLNGANTFGGSGQTVAVNAGILQISSDAALGNSANSLALNAATLSSAASFSSARAVALSGNSTFDTAINSLTLAGVVSGGGNLIKAGTGILTLSGANTYTGGTTINSGTVSINSAASLGSGTGALAINAGALEVATGFSTPRNITLGNVASTIQVDGAQNYTVNGVLGGAGALNKAGNGTLILTGANTFTGETIVDTGTLNLAATSGDALANTTAITVNAAGTLLLGASNQINNLTPITLNGGTLDKGNFSEGTASVAGLGALSLTDDSHLNFGTGTVGVLDFSSFAPGLSPDAFTLTIDNWTGTANAVGSNSTDRLIFNSDQISNLAAFTFTGYASGATEFSLGNGFWEVTPATPVPEPTTYATSALALLALAYQQRQKSRLRRSKLM